MGRRGDLRELVGTRYGSPTTLASATAYAPVVAFEVDRPLTCPVLIGRAAPLEALDALIEQTRAGAGATLLVSGEAGIGKTRLVERARAARRGAWPSSAQWQVFEADRVIAYAPLVDLLPELRQSQTRVRKRRERRVA